MSERPWAEATTSWRVLLATMILSLGVSACSPLESSEDSPTTQTPTHQYSPTITPQPDTLTPQATLTPTNTAQPDLLATLSVESADIVGHVDQVVEATQIAMTRTNWEQLYQEGFPKMAADSALRLEGDPKSGSGTAVLHIEPDGSIWLLIHSVEHLSSDGNFDAGLRIVRNGNLENPGQIQTSNFGIASNHKFDISIIALRYTADLVNLFPPSSIYHKVSFDPITTQDNLFGVAFPGSTGLPQPISEVSPLVDYVTVESRNLIHPTAITGGASGTGLATYNPFSSDQTPKFSAIIGGNTNNDDVVFASVGSATSFATIGEATYNALVSDAIQNAQDSELAQ